MSIEKGDATKYVHTGNGELCYELSEMEQERTFPMSDEGRTAMQLGGGAAFATPCALGEDAHPFTVLQHVGSAFQSRPVGRAALDGKRPHARDDHAQKALAGAKQGVARDQAHPSLGTNRKEHDDDVEVRVMGRNQDGARFLPGKGIHNLFAFNAEAEQHLAQKAEQPRKEQGDAVGDAVLLVVAGKRAVPILFMHVEGH